MNIQSQHFDSRALITTPDGERIIKPTHSRRVSFDMQIGLTPIDKLKHKIEQTLYDKKGISQLDVKHLISPVGFQAIYLLHINNDEVERLMRQRTFTAQEVATHSIQQLIKTRPDKLDAGEVDVMNFYSRYIGTQQNAES